MTMVGTRAPWQFKLEKVEQRCDYLLKSRLWADCFFEVDSERKKTVVPAHKLILAMASPVFEEMFYGEHSKHNIPMIPVSDVQPEAFKALLQYIYTGKIDITSLNMARKLWLEAKKYKLPNLEEKCRRYVCLVVGPRNACTVYEFARQIKERILMETCIQIISANTKEVLNDRSFVDAKLDTVLTMLSLDELNVDSELDLFRAVAKYDEAQKKPGQSSSAADSADGSPPAEELSESVEPPEDKVSVLKSESSSQNSPAAELDSKEPSEEVKTSEAPTDSEKEEEVPTIRTAIKKIRFLSMTPKQFADGPARSELLTKEESFAVLMNIASTTSAVPMPTGFSVSRERRQQRNEVEQEVKPSLLNPRSVSYGVIAATQLPTPAKIIEDLASTDRDTLKAAARAARLMSGDDNDDASEKLVEAGAIPLLVAALDQPWSGVQYDAAIALATLTFDHDHAAAVGDNGAVRKLVALLDRGGILAEQVALAIGNIAQRDSEELVDDGVLIVLVSRISDANMSSTLLENYLWSYRMICEHEDHFAMETTVLLYLEDILVLTDEGVLYEACSILCGMTENLDDEYPEQYSPQLTRRLIALLASHAEPRVQTLALTALENMMTIDELKDQCLEAGYLDHLINLLKCGNSSLVEDAAQSAKNILSGTKLDVQKALDKRILDPLGKILTERYHRSKLHAVEAVTCLCSEGSPSQLHELVFSAALEPYCQLLSDDHYNYEVQRGLTSLIQNIEENARDFLCQKLREFDVPKLLISMQEHEDELVCERAYYILKTYFGEDVSGKGRL